MCIRLLTSRSTLSDILGLKMIVIVLASIGKVWKHSQKHHSVYKLLEVACVQFYQIVHAMMQFLC